MPFLSRKQLSFQEATGFELRVRSLSKASGNITIRGFTKEGIFKLSHSVTGSGVDHTETIKIPDIPIMLTITDDVPEFMFEQCYVDVSLLLNNTEVYHFTAGYVSGKRGISWPKSENTIPELTKGNIEMVYSADPAAGVELSLTVPAYENWKVRAISFNLVAAAVAASRIVHLVFETASYPMYNVIAGTAVTSGQTKRFSGIPHFNSLALADDNDIIIPLPGDLVLPGNAVIKTETTALNAGDNFDSMLVLVEKYITERVYIYP